MQSAISLLAYLSIITIDVAKLIHLLTISETNDMPYKSRFMIVLPFSVRKVARRTRSTKETVILLCTVLPYAGFPLPQSWPKKAYLRESNT